MKATLLYAAVPTILAFETVGLFPNSHHVRKDRNGLLGDRNKILRRSPTELSVSMAQPGVSMQKKKRKKIGKKLKQHEKDSDQFQWLNWVYQQWHSTKPGELTEDVLKQMVPAISSWGRRKSLSSAQKAEELLERIIEENLAGNPHAELAVNHFNAAMDGYAKVGNPEGVQRILRRMETVRSEHNHLSHLKPDVFSMSTLATAWAKSRSPEAAVKAEGILRYMDVRKLTPNTITYNTVLHALAVGNQIDKAVRAEDIVNHMKERHDAGEDCAPDIYSYQCLIQAWAKTSLPGSPQKAEQILRFLDQQSEVNKKLSPNAHCFTTTIHAWARSSEKGRARSAYELLQYMRKRYEENFSSSIKPNVVAFTAVLNACARPVDESEREDAFLIGQLTMEELSLGTFDKPNFLSFAAFLSVCSSTLPPGDYRDSVVRRSFQSCADAGAVGNIVLDKLRVAASSELFDDLVGKYFGENGEIYLPKKWTTSIKGERAPSTQENDYPASRGRPETIPRSSKMRLQAVQKFGGKSGIYSSGKAPKRLESEGIQWTRRQFSSDQ